MGQLRPGVAANVNDHANAYINAVKGGIQCDESGR